jgi:hypothetical protein
VRSHFASDSLQTNKAGYQEPADIWFDLGGFVSWLIRIKYFSVSPNPSENGDFDFVTTDNSIIEP